MYIYIHIQHIYIYIYIYYTIDTIYIYTILYTQLLIDSITSPLTRRHHMLVATTGDDPSCTRPVPYRPWPRLAAMAPRPGHDVKKIGGCMGKLVVFAGVHRGFLEI